MTVFFDFSIFVIWIIQKMLFKYNMNCVSCNRDQMLYSQGQIKLRTKTGWNNCFFFFEASLQIWFLLIKRLQSFIFNISYFYTWCSFFCIKYLWSRNSKIQAWNWQYVTFIRILWYINIVNYNFFLWTFSLILRHILDIQFFFFSPIVHRCTPSNFEHS